MFGTCQNSPIDLNTPLAIGTVSFQPRLLLAPMSGVTNSAFRKLIRQENPGAVGLVVTEFISIEGLTRQNKQSMRMMHFDEVERPISIQIFGYDIERMCDAARMAEEAGAEIVDINSGCPVPKVVRRGGGCELMRQPSHMEEMIKAVRKAVTIPLTLKIRSGWDDTSRNGIEIARMAEDCGVNMLTVHGRTRVQLYRGLADWDFIGQVARSVSIPVVGSGDVVNSQTARERLESGATALMIGRGALSNPWCFSEIMDDLQGKPRATLSPEESALRIMRLLRDYERFLLEDMPEKGAIGKMKQLASQTIRAVPGAASVRRTLCRTSSLAAFGAIMDEYSNYLEGGTPCPNFLELSSAEIEENAENDPQTADAQTTTC